MHNTTISRISLTAGFLALALGLAGQAKATTDTADVRIFTTFPNGGSSFNALAMPFHIIVRNNGPDTARNIVAGVALDASFNLNSFTNGKGTFNSTTMRYTLAKLAPGKWDTLRLVVTPTMSNAGTYQFEGFVVSTASYDKKRLNDDARSSITIYPSTDTRVVKKNPPGPFANNSLVPFTLIASNVGPDQATNVRVIDKLPPGLVYESSSATQGAYNAANGTWTVGTLNAGDADTLTLVARVVLDDTATTNNLDGVIVHTRNRPARRTDFSGQYIIPQFDPAIGNLRRVEIDYSTAFKSKIRYEHTGLTSEPTITWSYDVDPEFKLNIPGSSIIIPLAPFGGSFEATSFDSIIDYDGASGFTADTAQNKKGTKVLNNNFSTYVGSGDVTFSETGKSNFSTSGPSNSVIRSDIFGDNAVEVRYYYRTNPALGEIINVATITGDQFDLHNEDNTDTSVVRNPSGPLPVVLTGFNAASNGDRVRLDWSTSQEINNSHFTIERGTSPREFKAIGKVNGHGTTSSANKYESFDNEPLNGRSYYRLAQTDFDGTIAYSQVVQVVRNAATRTELSAYPNPATTQLSVKAEGSTRIELLDAAGQVVRTMPTTGVTNMSLEGLNPGYYMLRTNTGSTVPVVIAR